jgi:hypothetical protein
MIRNYAKGFTIEDLTISAEAIGRTRFTVMWYFLIGGPGENNTTLDESLNFTLKYLNHAKPPPHIMATFFLGVRLYPGTQIWEMAMEEGLINSKCDPLEQLWYVSRTLDLERAIEQMNEAAAQCPGIILGFDEKYLAFGSKIVTFMGKIVPMPKPYWRHIIGFNRFLMKTGLRLLSVRKSIVPEIQHKLERQISFEKPDP